MFFPTTLSSDTSLEVMCRRLRRCKAKRVRRPHHLDREVLTDAVGADEPVVFNLVLRLATPLH
jgi:hypothetical protein